MKSDNVYIFKLEDGDQEFITSDNPVVLQNPNGDDTWPFDPSNIIKLPLDNKHYLMLMPNKNKENLKRVSRHHATGAFSRREELISNTEQLNGADEFVLGSASSLSRFLQIKDQDIILTQAEQEYEKALLDYGKKMGWVS